jgi:drug/metabolite transporter (DMT)-like permease
MSSLSLAVKKFPRHFITNQMNSQTQEEKDLTQKINWWQIIAALIIVAGALMTVWSAYQQDASLRTELLTETRIAELGNGAGQITALSGSAADIISPDYRALKAQLERIRLTTPQAGRTGPSFFMWTLSPRHRGITRHPDRTIQKHRRGLSRFL